MPGEEPDHAQADSLTKRCHRERIAAARAHLDAAVAALIAAVVDQQDFEFERVFDDRNDMA